MSVFPTSIPTNSLSNNHLSHNSPKKLIPLSSPLGILRVSAFIAPPHYKIRPTL